MNKAEQEYLNYLSYERGYSPRTLDAYQRDIDKFFLFLNDVSLTFADVNKQTVRTYLQKEISRGVSARSCQRRMSALRGFYSYCAKYHYVSVNPFALVHALGVKIGVVVGAGNIWRGRLAEKVGIEQSTGDYMGMLYENAYAEFVFTPVKWPDFKRDAFIDCLKEFQERNRRFGGLKNE